MKNFTTIASAFILLLGSFLVGLIIAWPAMYLWNNCLVGSIDGINQISFLQTWGIYILIQWLTSKPVSIKSKD